MAEMEGKLEGIAADLPSQLKQLEGCKFQGIYKETRNIYKRQQHLVKVEVTSFEVIEKIKQIYELDPPSSRGPEKFWKGITNYKGEWTIWAYRIESDDKSSGTYTITKVEFIEDIDWKQNEYEGGLFNIYLKAE
jgi:hypothetical protein